jgi:hypothetical protein
MPIVEVMVAVLSARESNRESVEYWFGENVGLHVVV